MGGRLPERWDNRATKGGGSAPEASSSEITGPYLQACSVIEAAGCFGFAHEAAIARRALRRCVAALVDMQKRPWFSYGRRKVTLRAMGRRA